jgi:tRNA (mo5U34)-methyltransferase
MTNFATFFEELLGNDKHIPHEEARAIRRSRLEAVLQPQWDEHRQLLDVVLGAVPSVLNLGQNVVGFGRAGDLSGDQQTAVTQYLNLFKPWKKGPYNIFGTAIDAEWRSDVKWDRIKPHLGSLEGKTVADIGCHNGYFMYRMAQENPQLVIGMEPVIKHWFVSSWLQQIGGLDKLKFELFGLEHTNLFTAYFDVVFCMGILYHHRNPIGALENIRTSLKPGGKVVIDCQAIPGSGPLSLVPRRKYAGATGVWFLPTQECLEHWVLRAGFSSWKVCYAGKLTPDEQRPTEWAPIESLQDFLSADGEKTIEGYPAPLRIYGIAER